MPLVSVVMPVFNCEAYVEAAVRSVLAQTEQDFELIVVNDGSTDSTLSIVERLAREDRRIHVHTQANSGKASIARNAGIRRATGQFVAFLDGDDLYHPGLLQRTLAVFKRLQAVGLVFSDYVFFSSGSDKNEVGRLASQQFLRTAAPYLQPLGADVYECDASFYRSLSTNAFGVVTTLTAVVRRDVLDAEATWFAEDLITYEDNDLWLRLALRTKFAYIDEVLGYYRMHAANTTSDPEKMARGAIIAKTRNLERGKAVLSPVEAKWCRRRIAAHYFNLGYLQTVASDRRAALRSFMSAARRHFTLPVILAIIKVLMPPRMLHLLRECWTRRPGRTDTVL